MKNFYNWFLLILFPIFISCSSDNEGIPEEEAEEVSPVVMDLDAVPYPKLSDYNFFKLPLADLEPVYGVLPYEPISALFSDYAHKKRFVWMPEGSAATFDTDATSLHFPNGAALIKNFYYESVQPGNLTKLIETRLMIMIDGEWLFANYVWNEEQTEAFYDMEGSFVPVSWLQNGQPKEVNYRVPNGVECVTCHNSSEIPLPIGTKPQHLNKNYTYADGTKNQLQKWKEVGYLTEFPNQINTLVNYLDESQDLEKRVRSYLDINCAHCHSENGFCNYRVMRFGFEKTHEHDNLGICKVPDEDISHWPEVGDPTHIIFPGDHEKSVIYYRLNTTEESYRMPLRGRTLIHEEGVEMIREWIDSLEDTCE